jgi:AraC-like DNA-binding protein
MLTYRETSPPAALAPFVRCLWTLSGEHHGGPERILPDGSFELVFHRGDPFRSADGEQPRAMLVGEIRRPVVLHSSGIADVSGVRFRAGGAAAFFDFPMHEARDRMIELDRWTPDLRVLRVPRYMSLVRSAVGEIRRRCGDLRVRDLASRLGPSERTLERAFLDVVGVTAKQMIRLVRFHAALRSDDTLAYYDQSHQIHEFRAFAGVTPTEFRREANAVNDAFVGNLQS